jgi:lysophospholipase L1-like esterase
MSKSTRPKTKSPTDSRRWFRRHPILALLGVNVLLFITAFLVLEIALRIWMPYNPGYYVGVRNASGAVMTYPWGELPRNSRGFPDTEFVMSDKPRIGYIGDSVAFGVGAGYGYRFSELLENRFPEFDHWNLAGVGGGITNDEEIETAVESAHTLGLDVVCYAFNLNDIMPPAYSTNGPKTSERKTKEFAKQHLDWLRGKSYAYTWARTQYKRYVAAKGIAHHGYRAVTLAAQRIEILNRRIQAEGAELMIVMLPYEMQISAEAAEAYAKLGIHWEGGFLTGSTQRKLLEQLPPDIKTIDLLPAFVDSSDPASSRAANRLGQYYVYNKGDSLDWNHPNRDGHARIASYLIDRRVFDGLEGLTRRADSQ